MKCLSCGGALFELGTALYCGNPSCNASIGQPYFKWAEFECPECGLTGAHLCTGKKNGFAESRETIDEEQKRLAQSYFNLYYERDHQVETLKEENKSLCKKLELLRDVLFTTRTTLQILNEVQTWDDCTTTIDEIDQALSLSQLSKSNGEVEYTSPLSFVGYGKNFPEDSHHENGSYQCTCCMCNSDFFGHKRRVVCRECSTPDSIKKELLELKTKVASLELDLSLSDEKQKRDSEGYQELTKENEGLKAELENYRSIAEQSGAVNAISERDNLKSKVEMLNKELDSLINNESKQRLELSNLRNQYSELVVLIPNSYLDTHDDVVKTLSQLISEQSQLKEKLAKALEILCEMPSDMGSSILSTPSQEQSLDKLQRVADNARERVGGYSENERKDLEKQARSQDITAETALLWLSKRRAIYYLESDKDGGYYVRKIIQHIGGCKHECVGYGKTPVEAIRSAMMKEGD